jgi:hypothetical protein
MMQPFIIIKSLSTGVLTDEMIQRFTVQRQRALPI